MALLTKNHTMDLLLKIINFIDFKNQPKLQAAAAHFCTTAVQFTPLEFCAACLPFSRLAALTGSAGGDADLPRVEGNR